MGMELLTIKYKQKWPFFAQNVNGKPLPDFDCFLLAVSERQHVSKCNFLCIEYFMANQPTPPNLPLLRNKAFLTIDLP